MKNRRDCVTDSLTASVSRLDAVLNPWGFKFAFDGVQASHCGPFSSGHYCRDATRIGLSCRDTIDNIYYEHSFITNNLYSRVIEQFTIGHDTLMQALGHPDDCALVCSDGIPDAVVARDGGDRVSALIHDLESIAARVLRVPCAEFQDIVRRGFRGYSVS